MRNLLQIAVISIAAVALSACHQQQTQDRSDGKLHLLAPEYPLGYGIPTQEAVTAKLDTVLNYLEQSTPLRLINSETGEEVTDYSLLSSGDTFDGRYRLTCYEWGVTYSAMLAAAKALDDPRYQKYVDDRFLYLTEVYPEFQRVYLVEGTLHPTTLKMVSPRALDDGGAICSAMMKAKIDNPALPVDSMIANYFDYVEHKEYRLADGTFARNRPHHNTVWLDDMFMGIPALAVMGTYSNNPAYYDQATKQIKQFAQRMWVPEKKLFRHGWVEEMPVHPSFFWGRANGWAILTMCEVLDQLPNDHPDRPFIIDLLNKHAEGLAALQGNDGLWHQLLDHPDTYGETSSTAIFTYAFAHAINQGWLDPKAYGPAAILGWNALAAHIQPSGEITGTCVGTGMGFDPAFYAYRPVSTKAGHIYGPTIWAGAEIVNLLNNQHPQSNDSAVQFYYTDPETSEPIFYLDSNNKGHRVQ